MANAQMIHKDLQMWELHLGQTLIHFTSRNTLFLTSYRKDSSEYD